LLLVKVMNVASVKLLEEYWRREKDHAKWAVTVDGQWICIGDINREVSTSSLLALLALVRLFLTNLSVFCSMLVCRRHDSVVSQ